MKILSKEVKTIIEVELTMMEYWDLREGAKDDCLRLNAWSECDLDDHTMGTVKNEFTNWAFIKGHTDIVKYICRKLGFDGIVNYGCYYEQHKVVRFQVYNRGETM